MKDFAHLHPAQLIKQVLGLKRAFGRTGFRLLYLWYGVFGEEGCRHREEVETFASVAKEDGIMFHSFTYQELICGMAGELRQNHEAHIHFFDYASIGRVSVRGETGSAKEASPGMGVASFCTRRHTSPGNLGRLLTIG